MDKNWKRRVKSSPSLHSVPAWITTMDPSNLLINPESSTLGGVLNLKYRKSQSVVVSLESLPLIWSIFTASLGLLVSDFVDIFENTTNLNAIEQPTQELDTFVDSLFVDTSSPLEATIQKQFIEFPGISTKTRTRRNFYNSPFWGIRKYRCSRCTFNCPTVIHMNIHCVINQIHPLPVASF